MVGPCGVRVETSDNHSVPGQIARGFAVERDPQGHHCKYCSVTEVEIQKRTTPTPQGKHS